MASDVSPRRAVNGQQTGRNLGKSVTNSAAMSLPVVDQEKLKGRLYSYAPHQASINTRALKFKRPTNTQMKKLSPNAQKLEPLVSYMF